MEVADFGLSRLGGEQVNKTAATSGPLKWMSPEVTRIQLSMTFAQAIVKRQYSKASDGKSFETIA